MADSDFIFRVSSINLTAAQKKQIATAIQGAVLDELAKLDLGGSSPDFLFRPITWAGGQMIPPDVVGTVLNSTLTVTAKTAT
jgi:hypothetical protein